MENFDALLICHQFFLIHPSLNFALCISDGLAHTANQDLPQKECRFDSGPGTTDKAVSSYELPAFFVRVGNTGLTTQTAQSPFAFLQRGFGLDIKDADKAANF